MSRSDAFVLLRTDHGGPQGGEGVGQGLGVAHAKHLTRDIRDATTKTSDHTTPIARPHASTEAVTLATLAIIRGTMAYCAQKFAYLDHTRGHRLAQSEALAFRDHLSQQQRFQPDLNWEQRLLQCNPIKLEVDTNYILRLSVAYLNGWCTQHVVQRRERVKSRGLDNIADAERGNLCCSWCEIGMK